MEIILGNSYAKNALIELSSHNWLWNSSLRNLILQYWTAVQQVFYPSCHPSNIYIVHGFFMHNCWTK